MFQNIHASMPLKVDLDLVCNTPEEKILSNVLANSRLDNEWIGRSEPNDGVAIICGSGPSLGDHIELIRKLHAKGGTIFALNGAASYLNEDGILPDYQVIMDAKPRTSELLGEARNHLFASQVDPSLFGKVPDAILWQATYGNLLVDEQAGFPKRGGYCLIGAHSSIGGTAPVLVYAMGYRTLHIFGLDSSNRANRTHVRHQAINDDDIYTSVEHRGVTYECSLTMRMQAYGFASRARALIEDGCTIHVHGDGLLPALWNSPLSEREKYEVMWNQPEYRHEAPGEHCVETFLSIVKPDGPIIDFGCGTGRGALELSRKGLDVALLDFAANSRDPGARHLPFVQHDLSQPIPMHAPYGFCTDVMEHLPPEQIKTVIRNIMASAKTVFFQISTVPDVMGGLIGHPLHLSVFSHQWWKEAFGDYSISWEQENPATSVFLVTTQG